jgi:ABC-type multidrug transport system ATPase subunit
MVQVNQACSGSWSLYCLLIVECTVEGFDVVKDYMKVREISGYMPGKFSLYQDLSVQENLIFCYHL